MSKIIFLILISFITNITSFAFASDPYSPQRGNLERKAILDALREQIQTVPTPGYLFIPGCPYC
ncbi:MAG: hypothetical protein HXY53_04985 [Nitrospirae bacterium]|nr:hypothetical protein [Nitrospirota bacterium]